MTPAHGLDLLTSRLGAATVDSPEWARGPGRLPFLIESLGSW